MGLFSRSKFDPIIDKATQSSNLSEDWSLYLHICDQINSAEGGVSDAWTSLAKKITSTNTRVAVRAIQLLDCCVKNCGREFRTHICQKHCLDTIERVARKETSAEAIKIREFIARWVSDYKEEMKLLVSLYFALQADNFHFPDVEGEQKRKQQRIKDENDAIDMQEAQELAAAIAASEADAGKSGPSSPQKGSGSGLVNGAGSQNHTNNSNATSSNSFSSPYGDLNDLIKRQDESLYKSIKETKKQTYAKALYDFEAAEDNEITFEAGHIIVLLDTSHDSWWSGKNLNNDNTGLFPSNFVEKLDYDPFDGSGAAGQKNSSGKGSGEAGTQSNNLTGPSTGNNNSSSDLPPTYAQAHGDGSGAAEAASISFNKLILPLDLDRADKTLEHLKNHDPEEDEDLTLKFNEILCTAMESEVNRRVQELDEKYIEINNINEKLNSLLNIIDMSQLAAHQHGYAQQQQQQLSGMTMGMNPAMYQGGVAYSQAQVAPGQGVSGPGGPGFGGPGFQVNQGQPTGTQGQGALHQGHQGIGQQPVGPGASMNQNQAHIGQMNDQVAMAQNYSFNQLNYQNQMNYQPPNQFNQLPYQQQQPVNPTQNGQNQNIKNEPSNQLTQNQIGQNFNSQNVPSNQTHTSQINPNVLGQTGSSNQQLPMPNQGQNLQGQSQSQHTQAHNHGQLGNGHQGQAQAQVAQSGQVGQGGQVSQLAQNQPQNYQHLNGMMQMNNYQNFTPQQQAINAYRANSPGSASQLAAQQNQQSQQNQQNSSVVGGVQPGPGQNLL